jgi:hypothetical protein
MKEWNGRVKKRRKMNEGERGIDEERGLRNLGRREGIGREK